MFSTSLSTSTGTFRSITNVSSDAALEKWTNRHPIVLSRLMSVPFLVKFTLKAASPVTAINGFRKCDIAPVDRNTFSAADFLAARVTDQGDHKEKFPQEAANTAERMNHLSAKFPFGYHDQQPCKNHSFPACQCHNSQRRRHIKWWFSHFIHFFLSQSF